MKIKTLAIAAATLAVGAITSQAQVYSQNIVGYATVTAPAGKYILVANPLTTGNDTITNVLHGLPGATILYYWNGSGWLGYTFSAGTGNWTYSGNNVNNTNLPPGQGFFLYNPTKAITNTFSGQIVCNTGGGTCTNTLYTGYTPVGSLIPYADNPTNSSTVNLKVGGASLLQIWDVASQKYDGPFQWSGGSQSWQLSGVNTNLSLNVAQGFFISPNKQTNWVQTLQ